MKKLLPIIIAWVMFGELHINTNNINYIEPTLGREVTVIHLSGRGNCIKVELTKEKLMEMILKAENESR